MKTHPLGCACLLLLATLAARPLSAQTQPAQQPAQTPTNPCPVKPQYRQFDFWVGEWDVTENGKKIATSSIQRIVGSCVIFENYAEVGDYTGKSFNFFDATLGKWRQTWVDGFGNVSEFAGQYTDGAMRFEGESHLQNGRRVLRRMTLFNLGADRVRQYSERSVDDGKTWSVGYDYIYLRRK